MTLELQIDLDLPEERKAYIARDADARFVLTTTDLSPFTLFGSRTVHMDDASLKEAVQNHSNQVMSRPSPDNLAFLLYTSGKLLMATRNYVHAFT